MNAQGMTIRLAVAVVMSLFGMALLAVALLLPPRGVIDPSVLVAHGEVMTFVGALFGLDYTHRIRVERLMRESKKKARVAMQREEGGL